MNLIFLSSNDEKFSKFESALVHLHDNLRDLLKYFRLTSISGYKEKANIYNDFLILAEFLKNSLINVNLNL